uniref:Non-capsid protein NS-1 n=1 Tax=Lygus hesperus TaxID=30085 RepID=A0A0A9YFR6_LYGHE
MSFYLNCGNIANFNRNCQFPLQDCINRRILLWNGPNCESTAFDNSKMLFGGDPLPARIKFSNDSKIPRTPIFVITNVFLTMRHLIIECSNTNVKVQFLKKCTKLILGGWRGPYF